MRRGLMTGLIVGGIVGTCYGMSMGKKNERQLRRMADDFLDRSEDVIDMMKDKTSHLMHSIH